MQFARLTVSALTISIALLASPSLRAADIALADLQGITVNASIFYAGNFRRADREAPGRVEMRSQIKVGPGSAITSDTTRFVTAETPRGTKSGQLHRSHNGEIGVPKKASDGSGDLVWLLQGSSLVRLRTLESGGNLFKIEFTKTPGGLTCKVDAPFAREVGGGLVKDTAALGGKMEFLNIRQTGSTCKVTRG
jgi:hypothetical protein